MSDPIFAVVKHGRRGLGDDVPVGVYVHEPGPDVGQVVEDQLDPVGVHGPEVGGHQGLGDQPGAVVRPAGGGQGVAGESLQFGGPNPNYEKR
jgi:hypothetical protein